METIRQYGVERLDAAGELDHVRESHEWFCRSAIAVPRGSGPADIDEAWCARFDRVVDDVGAALVWSAGDEQRPAQAADLAAELAALLFLRGWPAQAQRRYEQAADLAATVTARLAYLRLAAGAAASRFAGDDALRPYRMAADTSGSIGDRAGAARDLATMAMYINRAPGIMAIAHPRAQADMLIAEASALSDGSPLVQAMLAVAEYGDLPTVGDARRVVALAEQAGDAIVYSIALDLLTTAHYFDDLAEAARIAGRRVELLGSLPEGPLTGYEFADAHLMAAEIDVAAGNLAGAAAHAQALARLPFYRDEDHLAQSRRLLVDALAGHFEDVVQTAERFRAGWQRAGRPVAPNLARTSYAVAMVHGMRGDDERRAAWVRLTIDLGVAPEQLAGDRQGWSAVFDGLLALHHDDPAEAVRRFATDIDDPTCSGTGIPRSGEPGTPRCGPRPASSTTSPTRQPGSNGADTPPVTTQSRPPSSNAPQRSPPATTTPSPGWRSPSPNSAVPTSRQEPATSPPGRSLGAPGRRLCRAGARADQRDDR